MRIPITGSVWFTSWSMRIRVTNFQAWNQIQLCVGQCPQRAGIRLCTTIIPCAQKTRELSDWGNETSEGTSAERLSLLPLLNQRGIPRNSSNYCRLLQDCSSFELLSKGMGIHAQMIKIAFQPDIFLLNHLLGMHTKYGDFEDARQVFDKMSARDVVSWNSMIAGYVRHGLPEKALELFSEMRRAGVRVSQSTCVSVLMACAGIVHLEHGKEVQAHIVKTGFDLDVCVKNALITAYAKCGLIEDARQVFDKMPERDNASWKVMLIGFVQNGHVEEALNLFGQMVREGMSLNQFSFSIVVSACASPEVLGQGKQVHALVLKIGFESDVSVANALVSMYSKSGSMESACQMFDQLSHRDVVSWNAMIAGYVHNGYAHDALELFSEMQMADVKPNQSTFASFLKACASITSLDEGKQAHAQMIKNEQALDVVAENAILTMYDNCDSVDWALKVFKKMSKRNVVSWNAIIAGFAQHGLGKEVLHLFTCMQWEGLKVNSITFTIVLSSFCCAEFLEQGKQVHSNVVKIGLETNVSVGNSLLTMYAKCGSIENAFKLFTKMPERDVVSWNMMIAGCARTGNGKQALDLLLQMQLTGMIFNEFTFASAFSACDSLAALKQGQQIHAHVIKSGLEPDVVIMNALLTMYSKCGSIEDACATFRRMLKQDAISWNAMVAGYAQNGFGEEAVKLSCKMHCASMKLSHVTFASVVSACAALAALEQGKQFHAQIIRNGLEFDISVSNALITMYAKCASIEDACNVFDKMDERDMISWNAMIAGFAQHGQGKEALQVFEDMQLVGMKPNHITFVGILSACSHVGLVDEGHHYFDIMGRDYDIAPREEHYACMVDLLARAGQLVEAEYFIQEMPFKPGSLVWRTLLSGCKVHGDLEIGKRAAKCLLELEPDDTATYVLLSNIYASAGRSDDRENVRKMMKDRKVSKEPGCSWIEVKNRMHTFLVGDSSHPQTWEIYEVLEGLTSQMEEEGYMPNTNFLLHDIE